MTDLVDSNGDGMVSKDEFMKSHEAMFEMMKKNKERQINMTDTPLCSMLRGMPRERAVGDRGLPRAAANRASGFVSRSGRRGVRLLPLRSLIACNLPRRPISADRCGNLIAT